MKNGWRIARFDEILTKVDRKFIIDDDQQYETVGVRWYGNGAFIRERLLGANINRKQQWIIKVGDVVYNKLFAWKNAFAIADESVDGRIVSDKFPTYQIKSDLVEPKYLEYYFQTPQIGLQAQDLSKGAAAISKLTLNPPQFWDLTIPLPPLAEQRRIVAHIESLAARVHEAQRLREEADDEGKVISVSARNQVFGELQKNIQPVRFDTFADMRLGKMLSAKSKTGLNSKPYLRNANIQWDSLDLSSVYEMDFGQSEQETYHLMAGDILVCEGGDIGKSAIWNNELDECYFQKALHRVRVDRDNAVPRFILYHIFWAAEQGHFANLKTQTTIPHLTGVKLKAYNIYLPPLDEQRRIVAYLDGLQAKVNALWELQVKSGEKLSALMPSIFDKAFKGEF